jgi:hypothetical protein
MPNFSKFILSIICTKIALFSLPIKAESTQKAIDISGFSRLVAGVLDDKNASYDNYDDSVSLGQKSLVAIQIEGHITDNWSLTSQLLAHSSEQRNSGIEWLYTTYQATDALQFKLGKLRTPFFNYSDFQDVGYAYPWISPPQQVYNGFLFDSYEGASASYEIVEDSFSANTELYWGRFQDKISVGEQVVEAEINQFRGIILNVQYANLKLRLSTHMGNVNVDLPEVAGFAGALVQAGYPSMATYLDTTGGVKVYQMSLNYDALNYFVKSEIVRITSPIVVFPKTTSYYLSGGYIFYPFTVHATFAASRASYNDVQSTIRPGLAPQLDALSAGFDALFDNLYRDNLDSLTLGIRWDFTPGMALKADLTHLIGQQNERSFFTIKNPDAFDHKANLLQVAWEWVF